MANKKLPFIVLMFLVLLALPTFSAQMGIGIEPTIVDVYLSDSNKLTYVPFKLSNPSDTPNYYTMEIENDLKDYMHFECNSYPDYWCTDKEVYVAPFTSRQDGVVLKVLFQKKTYNNTNFTSYLYFNANPRINETGIVALKPRISVKVSIHQISFSNITPAANTATTTGNSGIQTQSTQPTIPTNAINVGDRIVSDMWIKDNNLTVNTTNKTTVNKTKTVTEIEQPSLTAQKPAENSLIYFFAIIGVIGLIGGGYYMFKDRIIFVLILMVMLFAMPMLSFADGVNMNVTVCPALVNITNQTTCVDCNHYWYTSSCHATPYVAPPTPPLGITGLFAMNPATAIIPILFVVFLIYFSIKWLYKNEKLNFEDLWKILLFIIVAMTFIIYIITG